MKLKLLLASAFLATSAFAVESDMKVIARFDYVNAETKEAGTTTTSGEMQTSYLKWKNAAKFNDTITGELTIDLTDSSDAPSASDSINDFVDTAFITKTFGPGLSLTLGKQAVLVGGRENDWSGADVYTLSTFNEEIPGNAVGATLGYSVANQTFYAQYQEASTESFDNNGDREGLTDKKITGVAWYGNIMDLVNPIVSYHKVGTNRPGQYDTFLGAGLQFNVSNFLVEFDYNMLTQENATATSPTTAVDAELNSMVAHVRYNHENFRPFVKYIMDDAEQFDLGVEDAAAEQERMAYEIGLEYLPAKDEALRYHVVYNHAETKNSIGAENKVEDTSIIAGVKFNLSL